MTERRNTITQLLGLEIINVAQPEKGDAFTITLRGPMGNQHNITVQRSGLYDHDGNYFAPWSDVEESFAAAFRSNAA